MSHKAVALPAVFSGIRSRRDRSYSLTFDTRELGGQDAATLLGMQQSECWLLVAPNQDALAQAEVPDYKPDVGMESKPPSKRLRSIMFVYWKQQGGEQMLGDFDGWYARAIERLIDQYKAKLDDGEAR